MLKKNWTKFLQNIFFFFSPLQLTWGKLTSPCQSSFKWNVRPKFEPCSSIFLIDFIEKELSKTFCGVLIIFHELMMLQGFEFDVSDFIPVNVQNISDLFFYILAFILCRMTPWQNFKPFLIIFQEVVKLRNFERLDSIWTQVTSFLRIN